MEKFYTLVNVDEEIKELSRIEMEDEILEKAASDIESNSKLSDFDTFEDIVHIFSKDNIIFGYETPKN